MRKSTTDAEGAEKPITYKNLAALKAAKSRKTAPRGLKFNIGSANIVFTIPKQETPVLEVKIREYVEASLKSDGFKPDESMT